MCGSKTGWALVTLYLVVASVSLVEALNCRGSFFCGFAAIPLLVPSGFVYLWILADHLPSPAVLQWQVIVPTLVTNALVYYLLGARVLERFRRRGGR